MFGRFFDVSSSEPDFNRTRTALYCGTPDSVPLMELKVDTPVMSAFLGRPVETTADKIAFQRVAGYDYVRLRAGYNFLEEWRVEKTDTYSAYGDGEATMHWAREHDGLIRTREDLRDFNFPTLEDADFSALAEAAGLLPEGMKIMSSTTGIWESVWQVMGFENFCFAYADDPGMIDEVFEAFAAFHFDVFRKEIDMPGVAGMWYTDDFAYATGPMVDPAILRRHVFPVMKKMGVLCREREMPLVFHSDGDLTQVLEDIIDAGANALHPIEPKAMDIMDLKRKYAGKLALVGNIDVDLLTRATPDEIRRVTEEKIRTLGPDGYCVGSSNSVPPWVPVENYRAMVETALAMRAE